LIIDIHGNYLLLMVAALSANPRKQIVGLDDLRPGRENESGAAFQRHRWQVTVRPDFLPSRTCRLLAFIVFWRSTSSRIRPGSRFCVRCLPVLVAFALGAFSDWWTSRAAGVLALTDFSRADFSSTRICPLANLPYMIAVRAAHSWSSMPPSDVNGSHWPSLP
jgi:hypothetical protein